MAGLTVDEILGVQLNKMSKLTVNTLSSALVKNRGGTLQVTKLPFNVQWSPVFAFITGDFNKDGANDIITGGNFFDVLPFEGRYDASYGDLLLNQASSFISVPSLHSGLQLGGQVRDIKKVRIRGKDFLIIARNNEGLLFYSN